MPSGFRFESNQAISFKRNSRARFVYRLLRDEKPFWILTRVRETIPNLDVFIVFCHRRFLSARKFYGRRKWVREQSQNFQPCPATPPLPPRRHYKFVLPKINERFIVNSVLSLIWSHSISKVLFEMWTRFSNCFYFCSVNVDMNFGERKKNKVRFVFFRWNIVKENAIRSVDWA